MNQPLSPPVVKHDRDTTIPDIHSATASSAQSDTLRDAVRATVKE